MPTIQGKIAQCLPPRSGQNDRGAWAVQEFVLESYDQPYARRCVFSVFGQDRLQQFNIQAGENLSVDIDIDAREYNGRYYNSVRAWRVTRIPAPQPEAMPQAPSMPPMGAGAPIPPAQNAPQGPAPVPAPAPPAIDPLAGDATEDLPF